MYLEDLRRLYKWAWDSLKIVRFELSEEDIEANVIKVEKIRN